MTFPDVGPTLIGILPYAGLKFYIYEELKARVPENHRDSIVLRLSCGALAGLFGQTLTYPLDVVRRQMQVIKFVVLFHVQFDPLPCPTTQVQSDEHKIRSTFQGLTTVIRVQGWRKLFAGLSLNYLKVRRMVNQSDKI